MKKTHTLTQLIAMLTGSGLIGMLIGSKLLGNMPVIGVSEYAKHREMMAQREQDHQADMRQQKDRLELQKQRDAVHQKFVDSVNKK